MSSEFLLYVAAGFIAQLIDGALGMAYGVTASSLLLSFGVSPATASATVHAAECFTSGVSGLSHRVFGNIDKQLFRKLLLPGMCGAAFGAFVLSSFPGDAIKPYIASYLLVMGCLIIWKAFRPIPPASVTTHLGSLAFSGGFADSVGGGGWGPIVTSTLIARGNDLRLTVGSVNAVEFFIAFASSFTFFLTIGLTNWMVIVGLAVGGLFAAPLGAWACRSVPVKPFMICVGVLVVTLSVRTLVLAFGLI